LFVYLNWLLLVIKGRFNLINNKFMDNQQPTKKPLIIGVIIFILVIGLLSILSYRELAGDKVEPTEEETSLGVSGPRIIDLIGTGNVRLGDICSYGTSTTLFQFASSTTETWWDTKLSGYPQYYGATPTAAFLVKDAELVTFNYVYHILTDHAATTLTCEYAVSNSDNCNNASSTLNTAIWMPVPAEATSTQQVWEYAITASSSFSFAPAAVGDYEWAHTFSNINYKCMELKCYNASTTADNTLWVTATLKEE
jgi:hypothetical protein